MINRYLNRRPSWRYVPYNDKENSINQSKSKVNNKLTWFKTEHSGETCWEALSPFSSDGDSADISWRIKKGGELLDYLYYACSDAECPHVCAIGTLQEVKAAIQEKHDTILESVKLEQEAKSEHRYNLNLNNSQ